MLSKTLWFNRGIFIQNLRNVGWIGIVHVLVLFAAIPLQLVMMYTKYTDDQWKYLPNWNNVFEISNVFQGMVVFTIPVLLAIFLFRYMQVKRSADYIHSLPIRREALFYQHIAFGTLMLIVPILFTAVLTIVLCYALPWNNIHFSIVDIIIWAAETCLMELFVFSASVCMGILTGISVLQGALSYILLLFPAGISVLVLMNMKYVLFGFAADYYLNANLEHIIPFFRFIELRTKPLTVAEVSGYLFLIVVFCALSLWLYKKRHSEVANQALAFPLLRPVFKYGVAFCTMLVGGFYFGETQRQFAWIIFGYITFSLIGFFVAEMIIEKTWRVFHKWKGYVYFAMAMLVIGVFLHLDITGYEKRLPSLGDIQRVYFGESAYEFENNREQSNAPLEQSNQFLKTKSNIKNVYLFHQQLIHDRPTTSLPSSETRQVAIGYELKNGEKMIRTYNIPFETYKNFYKSIMESTEYKKNFYFLLHDKGVSPIRQVTIHAFHPFEKTVMLTDPKQVQQFVSILKTELENETVDDMLYARDGWGDMELLQSDGDNIPLTWKKSYLRLEKWLEQQGLLSKARTTADDIQYAIVIKNEERKPLYELTEDPNFQQQLQTRTDVLRITDKKQLEECLRESSEIDDAPLYIIAYYRSNHSGLQWSGFTEQHVPGFIRESFK